MRWGWLVCLFASAVSAAELGRVFFTSAERLALDAARQPSVAKVNGVVRRDGQVRLVWRDNLLVSAVPAVSGPASAARLHIRRHE